MSLRETKRHHRSPVPEYMQALTRVYNRKYRSGRDCVRHLIGFSSCYPEPTYTDANGRIRGALYSNPFDCLWKTLKTEGFLGWYKGTTAHFLRIAPHTVCGSKERASEQIAKADEKRCTPSEQVITLVANEVSCPAESVLLVTS